MKVGVNYWKSNSLRQQWEDLQVVTFFMPLNMLPPDMRVDSKMKYNQTWGFNDYNAHSSHISYPLSQVYTWRKHKLRHGHLYSIMLCVLCVALKTQRPLCLHVSNHVNNTLHPRRPFSQSTTVTKTKIRRQGSEFVPVYIWRKWNRCVIQPLNCHLSERTTKGVNAIIPCRIMGYVHTQSLCANINLHIYT